MKITIKSRHIPILFFSLVLIGVAFWYVRTQSNNTGLIEQPDPDTKVTLIPKDKAEQSPEHEKRFQQLVRWEVQERQLDLKRMPLEMRNGEALLKVKLALKPVCFPGDADAIDLELDASPNHRLLVTIEPLSETKDNLSWTLPDNFLKKGLAEHEFKIRVSDKPLQYGFFLCTAESNDSRCGDKPVEDVNVIFREHIRGDKHAGKTPRNIFFQYFLADTRGLSAFSGTDKRQPPFEKLKNYLKERHEGNTHLDREVDLAKKHTKALKSFPFRFEGNTLQIELPQYQASACAPQK